MTVPGCANPLLMYGDAGVYQIERSLRFNSSDSAYLSRTPSSAGNRRTWTLSLWVKRANLGAQQKLLSVNTASDNGNAFNIDFDSSDRFSIIASSGGADILTLTTTQVFRDVSAWYHILLSVDTTQSTASNRLKLYANGQQVTIFTTASYPAQNADLRVNNNEVHYIGRLGYTSVYCNAYLADIHLIDGSALDPSSFTEVSATTGQLIPKAYTGTFTGNSFWLKFSDNSSTTSGSNVGIGKDFSGLGNYWDSTNLSVTAGAGNDSLVDTPTSYGTDTYVGGEVRGNYCTLNPLNVQLGAGSLSNGNLDLTGPSGSSAYNYAGGTFGIDTSTSTGWYFEFTQTIYGQFASIGLLDQSVSASALNNLYIIGHSFANQTAGISYSNGGSIGNYGTLTTGLTSWTSSGDVIGVAIKDNKIWFATNNTWISGSPSAGTSPSITLASTKYVTPAAIGINSSVLSLNAGQRPFAYTAPSGFKALCDTNLPAPVVAKPNTVMDVVLYSGTGSNQTITGLNFNPDFVWLKRRSSAQAHYLYDVIRGTSSVLYSDGPDAEQSISTGLTAFNSNGFSLGSLSGVNASSTTNVAWTWDAGSSTVSNPDGSITSSVRANQSAGFSVVSVPGYTYPTKTAGHGLGVEPHFIITKNRGASNPWIIYHKAAGANTYFQFDTGAGYTGVPGVWSGVSSTVFPINSGVNQQTDIIAYCFAPVTGYSSFGSYTGNGSATDNTFVYTGMRPRFVMLKRSDSTGNWVIWDAVRNSYNVANSIILPNSSAAEYSPDAKIDILSNGFKVRDNSSDSGTNGATYIYAAFAESPFQYSRAR